MKLKIISDKINNLSDADLLMMEGKIDKSDIEGQFGKPEMFARDGVADRMDQKFPHHPLIKSEAKYVID